MHLAVQGCRRGQRNYQNEAICFAHNGKLTGEAIHAAISQHRLIRCPLRPRRFPQQDRTRGTPSAGDKISAVPPEAGVGADISVPWELRRLLHSPDGVGMLTHARHGRRDPRDQKGNH